MKRFLFITLSIILTLSACTPKPVTTQTATALPAPASPFDYDASIPFDTKITSQSERGGVTIVDLNYATHEPDFSITTGGRTVAYLVKPQGKGPFAGIIYLHWLGNVTGNRGEFLDEAVEMAKHGVVSLVLQGYFPWMASPLGTQADRPLMIGQVVELRRAIDFLLTQPDIDPDRLGYVGHDYGAVYGGILAGVDQRIKTYVLVAGVPSFADWISFFHIAHDPYLPVVQGIDPILFVPLASPASILFQFGQKDAFVSGDLANKFYDAASQPKKVEWFDDIHEMATPAVLQARQAWLIDQLNLKPTPASPFDYDRSIPFDTKVASETERDGVTIVDLNYAAHAPDFSPSTGGRTLAYLVKPQGEGPFAGVIYLHWLGATNSTRAQFLDEAVATAKRGAVCLLVQGYFPWMANPTGSADDRPLIIGQVIELRRAIDFLLSQSGVDPDRLGFVGHDYGATYGGVLAGVDHRLKTYILVAGAPSFSEYMGLYIPHEQYLKIVQDLDPLQYIGSTAPSSILFQFGKQDGTLSQNLETSYYNAASQPKQIEWYDDIHDMSSQAVRQARQEWLAAKLNLDLSTSNSGG